MHKETLKRYRTSVRNRFKDLDYNVIYLTGDKNDYYKILFVNPKKNKGFRFELKEMGNEVNSGVSCIDDINYYFQGQKLTFMTKATPAKALKMLIECPYVSEEGKDIPKPDFIKFATIVELLHDRM